jgi:hypothetical protein
MKRLLITFAAFAIAANAHAAEKTLPFNLVPGSCSAPIQIVFNKPVTLSGGNTAANNRGVAQVTIVHSGKVLTWAGLDLNHGLEGGFQVGAPGMTVAWLDFHEHVAVMTAASAHIEICNSSDNDANATGNLTLLY